MAPRKRASTSNSQGQQNPKKKRQAPPPSTRRTRAQVHAQPPPAPPTQQTPPAPPAPTEPEINNEQEEVASLDSQIIEQVAAAENTSQQQRQRGLVNSTVRNELNYNASDYNTERLISAMVETLNTVREFSFSGNNSQFVNRMTTAKDLPSFSGDPLEWIHFKGAYDLSTETGGYTNRENISRLFSALKGEAREVVNTLLATSNNADSIIRTLELHYGNKHVVAEKIFSEVKSLPDIESGKISLTQFATKLKNAVVAFKSLKLTGYLHSPDLVRVVGEKLPSALKFAYNRHAATLPETMAELEKLSQFLFAEAELAAAAGIFNFNLNPPSQVSQTENKRNTRQTKTVHAAQHATAAPQSREEIKTKKYNCVLCSKGAHHPSKCASFVDESLENRWKLARLHKLCFNCLKTDHSKEKCESSKCSQCDAPHHKLLHRTKNTEKRNNTRTSHQDGEVNNINSSICEASTSMNNSSS